MLSDALDTTFDAALKLAGPGVYGMRISDGINLSICDYVGPDCQGNIQQTLLSQTDIIDTVCGGLDRWNNPQRIVLNFPGKYEHETSVVIDISLREKLSAEPLRHVLAIHAEFDVSLSVVYTAEMQYFTGHGLQHLVVTTQLELWTPELTTAVLDTA